PAPDHRGDGDPVVGTWNHRATPGDAVAGRGRHHLMGSRALDVALCSRPGRRDGPSRGMACDASRQRLTDDREPAAASRAPGETSFVDRDRGTPRGATPPTPPGVRVTYHGGSTGLSLDRD